MPFGMTVIVYAWAIFLSNAALRFMSDMTFLPPGASGFNLDKTNTKIIEADQTQAGFGFSVALWMDHNKDKWVVVGAPKWQWKNEGNEDRNLHSSNSSDGVATPNGAVLLCNLQKNCQPIKDIPVLSEDEKKALKIGSGSKFPSIGLGETIVSSKNSSLLLVCAPRQMGITEDKEVISLSLRGVCYCIRDRTSKPIIIAPFAENYVTWYGKIFQTPSANTGKGAAFIDDKTVIVGAPAMFMSSGVVISYNVESGRQELSKVLPTSDKNIFYEGWAIAVGTFDETKKYYAVSLPGKPPNIGKVKFYYSNFRKVPQFGLKGEQFGARFGDSLVVGDFDGDGVDDLVVSAYLSEVAVNTANSDQHTIADAGKVYIYYSPLKHIGKSQRVTTLNGKEYRSYFGFSIFCPGDLNLDGFDDLVVGAPYEDQGKGKIYVFYGSLHGIRTSPSQTIVSSELYQQGMKRNPKGIGFSLGGGIDLDANGYPDIVIGALKSSSAFVVRTAPVVKFDIKASFNDSDVIRLGERKRPIVLPNNSSANVNFFELKLQIQYICPHFQEDFNVIISIELDARKPVSRILTKDHARTMGIVRSINNVIHEPRPFLVKVYLRPRATLVLDDPIYTKVRVSLVQRTRLMREMKVEESKNHIDRPLIVPVEDIFSDNEVEMSVRLLCKDEESCFTQPDLKIDVPEKLNFTVGSTDLLFTNITLGNSNDPAYQVHVKVTVPRGFSFVRVHRHEETILDSILWCHGDEIKNDDDLRPETISCLVTDNLPVGKTVKFSLLFSHSPLDIMATWNTKAELNGFKFLFNASSDRDETATRNDNSDFVIFQPILIGDAYLISSSNPESVVAWTNDTAAMKKSLAIIYRPNQNVATDTGESDNVSESAIGFNASDYIGPTIHHKYTILNNGISPITDAKINISWPAYINEFPITLIKKIRLLGPVQCDDINENLKYKHYQLNEPLPFEAGNATILSRKRRAVLLYEKSEMNATDSDKFLSEGSSQNVMLKMNCDTYDCFNITCRIGSFVSREEASIEVEGVSIAALFTAWNSRHFLLTSEMLLESKIMKIRNTTSVSTVVSIGKKELSKKELILQQWWILIVSMLAGILIILLISGCLYQCGFFKRKRAPDVKTETGYHGLFISERPLDSSSK